MTISILTVDASFTTRPQKCKRVMQTVKSCVETLVWFLSLTSKPVSIMSREELHSIFIKKKIDFKTTLSVICYLGLLSKSQCSRFGYQNAQSEAHLFPGQSSGCHRWFGRNWTTVSKHKIWLSSRTLGGALIQHFGVTCSPSRTLPDELETFLGAQSEGLTFAPPTVKNPENLPLRVQNQEYWLHFKLVFTCMILRSPRRP